MNEIKVRNVGPVANLDFKVEFGKVNVIKGRNGSGKSYTLKTAQALIKGQGTGLQQRDGSIRGELEGFGAVLRLARSVRRTGDVDVVSLEGRFNVADLVDPGIKAPDAADAQRIKALVQLAGGSGADPALFYGLIGGQKDFEHYVSPSATDTDDLVTMAARIKRDLEKHARMASDQAEREVAAAEAARALTVDVDLNGPDDAEKLQAELEFAITENQRLNSQAQAINRQLLTAHSARNQLADAQASYAGLTVGETARDETNARIASELAASEVARLEDLLHVARNEAQKATMQHEKAVAALQSVTEHEQTLSAWRAAIDDAANVEPVEPVLLEQAAADVTIARQALERGTLIRQAKAKLTAATEHMTQAAGFRRVSDWLRDAGKATDDVLSDLVGKLGCSLTVSGGRLMVEHPVRGVTYYGELSDGERWKVALDIAIDAVGPNGLLVIEQHAWQDLDPINRGVIIDHVAQSSVAVLTAECDAGELRAEVA